MILKRLDEHFTKHDWSHLLVMLYGLIIATVILVLYEVLK